MILCKYTFVWGQRSSLLNCRSQTLVFIQVVDAQIVHLTRFRTIAGIGTARASCFFVLFLWICLNASMLVYAGLCCFLSPLIFCCRFWAWPAVLSDFSEEYKEVRSACLWKSVVWLRSLDVYCCACLERVKDLFLSKTKGGCIGAMLTFYSSST